ncbi:MAG: glycosyltransferase family 2 protein [Erysipelotrichales bacterium]|nr:glycosyltransferase family 2 protein [Erysipelotrichales bacterium]
MKTVSIITTFYNAERFILSAIKSIFMQTVAKGSIKDLQIEYIIVDDKSEDNSRKIVDDFITKNKNSNLIWKLIEPEQNLGCGGARKFGIDNATGDYFMFLDADDYYINSDFVERAVKDIENEKADIIEYGIVYNQSNGSQSISCPPKKIVIDSPDKAEIALFKDNLIKFNVWSKIYKRWIVESYPYSTTRLFEDVRTIPVWISKANKIVVMPTCEINYRAASSSIIRSNWVETRLGTITAIAELFPMFAQYPHVLKAMYTRSMIDLEALLHNHSSENEGFNEMSKLNTRMLRYIYPNSWKEKVFHDDGFIEELEKEVSLDPKEYIKTDLHSLPGM